ncbi:DUF6795 domain-containing protein [Massilia sp. W12]|uniref:DUF6795 domain-containing protein n=1 Tax=Massilia sp. W12 TaxID=3126507 RepID=UPI0030D0A8EC
MSLRNFFVAILLSSLSLGACAMGGKVMFSAVTAQVVKGGKPVAGAKVVREYTWHWDDKKVVEETQSDSNGRFQFPRAEKGAFLASFIPHEPVISQIIRIHHEGKEFMAWNLNKHNYDDNGELHGKPLKFVCDLQDKPGAYLDKDIWGLCKPQ